MYLHQDLFVIYTFKNKISPFFSPFILYIPKMKKQSQRACPRPLPTRMNADFLYSSPSDKVRGGKQRPGQHGEAASNTCWSLSRPSHPVSEHSLGRSCGRRSRVSYGSWGSRGWLGEPIADGCLLQLLQPTRQQVLQIPQLERLLNAALAGRPISLARGDSSLLSLCRLTRLQSNIQAPTSPTVLAQASHWGGGAGPGIRVLF